MAVSGFQVTGGRELAAAFTAAARDRDLLHAAGLQSAQIVGSRARQRAPRKSGRLAASIQSSAEPGASVITVGVVYAGNQEFGWHNRPNRSRGWRGGPFPGHYYVMGAISDTEAAQVDAYATNVDQVLDQIARTTPKS